MSSSPTLRAATSAQTLWVTARHLCERRIADARRHDEGLTTLEIVVWGVGLFVAAGAAVAIVTGVISEKTAQIKCRPSSYVTRRSR